MQKRATGTMSAGQPVAGVAGEVAGEVGVEVEVEERGRGRG
jgi:hypothetical protein